MRRTRGVRVDDEDDEDVVRPGGVLCSDWTMSPRSPRSALVSEAVRELRRLRSVDGDRSPYLLGLLDLEDAGGLPVVRLLR